MLKEVELSKNKMNFNKSNCICNNQPIKTWIRNRVFPFSQNLADDSDFSCPDCGKLFHKRCIGANNPDIKQCPICIMLTMDPLQEIQAHLIQPYLIVHRSTTASQNIVNFTISTDNQALLDQTHENYGIEVRCLQIGDSQGLQTWPWSGKLVIDNKEILAFNPLKARSCLHRRKDEKFFMTKSDKNYFSMFIQRGVPLLHTFSLMEDTQDELMKKLHITRETLRNTYKIEPEEKALLCGVFLTRRLTSSKLIIKLTKYCQRSVENSKLWIQKVLKKSSLSQEGIIVEQTKVELTDCVTKLPIKTPARGKHCNHLSCFSLENHIQSNELNPERKWKCQICSKRASEIYIDMYLQDIIQKGKMLENNEIILNNNGDLLELPVNAFNLIQTPVKEENLNEQTSSNKKQRTKKVTADTIILDLEDEIQNYNLNSNQMSEPSNQYPQIQEFFQNNFQIQEKKKINQEILTANQELTKNQIEGKQIINKQNETILQEVLQSQNKLLCEEIDIPDYYSEKQLDKQYRTPLQQPKKLIKNDRTICSKQANQTLSNNYVLIIDSDDENTSLKFPIPNKNIEKQSQLNNQHQQQRIRPKIFTYSEKQLESKTIQLQQQQINKKKQIKTQVKTITKVQKGQQQIDYYLKEHEKENQNLTEKNYEEINQKRIASLDDVLEQLKTKNEKQHQEANFFKIQIAQTNSKEKPKIDMNDQIQQTQLKELQNFAQSQQSQMSTISYDESCYDVEVVIEE